MANEALGFVKQAFSTEGAFSFEGPFHQYQNVTLSVKPVQKPYPPLWMQSRDADTLAILAQEGVHTGYLFLVPRQEVAPRYREYLTRWNRAGHPEKPNIGYWVLVYVDETDEKAVAKAKPYFAHCFTKVFGTRADGGIGYLRLAENFAKRGDPGGAEIAKNAVNLDYLLDHNLAFVGSPQTVTKKSKRPPPKGCSTPFLASSTSATSRKKI